MARKRTNRERSYAYEAGDVSLVHHVSLLLVPSTFPNMELAIDISKVLLFERYDDGISIRVLIQYIDIILHRLPLPHTL